VNFATMPEWAFANDLEPAMNRFSPLLLAVIVLCACTTERADDIVTPPVVVHWPPLGIAKDVSAVPANIAIAIAVGTESGEWKPAEREALANAIHVDRWDPATRKTVKAPLAIDPTGSYLSPEGTSVVALKFLEPVSGSLLIPPPTSVMERSVQLKTPAESPWLKQPVLLSVSSCPHFTYFRVRPSEARDSIAELHLGVSEPLDAKSLPGAVKVQYGGTDRAVEVGQATTSEEGTVSHELVLRFSTPVPPNLAGFSVDVSRTVTAATGQALAGRFGEGELSCEPADFRFSGSTLAIPDESPSDHGGGYLTTSPPDSK
jgi:hypothetical protein